MRKFCRYLGSLWNLLGMKFKKKRVTDEDKIDCHLKLKANSIRDTNIFCPQNSR